jgi:hypothetical protein
MVIPSTGQISFRNLQTEFGGNNPIGLSEYYSDDTTGYTGGIRGIPNIGSSISFSQFRGKKKPIITKNYSSSISSAYGQNGARKDYVTSFYDLPSDFRRLISWKMTINFTKSASGSGIGSPTFGIINPSGRKWITITLNGNFPDGNYYLTKPAEFSASYPIGNKGDKIGMFISFIGAANVKNIRFTLEVKYTS